MTIDDRYLSSRTQWQGRFWLPGQEDPDQRGILMYDPDRGLRLSLIGGFDDAEWLPEPTRRTRVLSEGTRSWPVIHGSVARQRCAVSASTTYAIRRR